MDPHAARLAEWLAKHDVAAEHRTFEVSTHSVAEAAAAVGASAEDFIKSICMVAEDGGLVVATAASEASEDRDEPMFVAIVKGEDRASTTRVAAAIGAPVRLAKPEEMLSRTGYPAGGTPPLGFDATFLVDERVMERAFVWGGGGSDRALLRIAPAEILRANGGRVARVRK